MRILNIVLPAVILLGGFLLPIETGPDRSQIDQLKKQAAEYLKQSTLAEQRNAYAEAFKFYEKYKAAEGTVIEIKGREKLNQMKTRFEVHKKESKLALLKKDKQLEELALTKQTHWRNFLLFLTLVVLVLVFVVYAMYRIKIRFNHRLRNEMQERRRAEAQLLQSMKLESVGIIAGDIAYGFDQLVAQFRENVAGIVELVKDDLTCVRMLSNAQAASRQASELAGKLITFADGGWLVFDKVSVAGLFKEIMEHHPQLRPLLRRVSIPPNLPPIRGDERQLRQVMINLLQNAQEATGEQKIVAINARTVRLDQSNPLSLTSGLYINVTIKDNGSGISPEHLGKVFDPYFSTRDEVSRKGMGLGLAVCYTVIKKHNGSIQLESEPGKGTEVTLHLPVYTEG